MRSIFVNFIRRPHRAADVFHDAHFAEGHDDSTGHLLEEPIEPPLHAIDLVGAAPAVAQDRAEERQKEMAHGVRLPP